MSLLPCSFVEAINVKGVEKCKDGLWEGYIDDRERNQLEMKMC